MQLALADDLLKGAKAVEAETGSGARTRRHRSVHLGAVHGSVEK